MFASLVLLTLPLLAQTQPAPSPTGATSNDDKIEPVKTSITVTEKITAETPASISVLGTLEIRQTPGVNLDDRLRTIPGFSLFRRSSSVAANPTTQGVSLRALGSTGASRTLVLWDGIPLNDPFGGWIYWTRIAPEDIERVEISRGASTSLFGDRAIGGALHVFSRPPERRRFTASYEGGTRNTHEVTGGASHTWRQFGASANLRLFQTDGYFIVPERFRGTIDTPAGVRFAAGTARLDYLGKNDRIFARLDVLTEDRANGTELQRNSTSLGSLAANYAKQFSSRDSLSILGYHTRSEFHASFTAIAANRLSERLTSTQVVPSEATGGAAYYTHNASVWNGLFGADVERAEGYSTDRLVPTGVRFGGGARTQHGVFTQLNATAGPVKFFGGARHHVTGTGRNFFSPSGGLTAGKGIMRFRGSVYRSFRNPTLNELYREFRAGNTATLANDQLQPETLFGAEVGVDMVGETRRMAITAYRNDMSDVITNVTLSTTPTLITRQRRNNASALTKGVEISARQNWRMWSAEASYLFAESRFGTLERVPQIPKHQGNAQVNFQRKGTIASAGIRSFSMQFEDDRNTLRLPGFASVQLMIRQKIARRLSFTAAFENLLDREYFTGLGVVPNIGPPRLVRAGLRWGL
jgi:outer membrane receptor protein involved in Fe transport